MKVGDIVYVIGIWSHPGLWRVDIRAVEWLTKPRWRLTHVSGDKPYSGMLWRFEDDLRLTACSRLRSRRRS